METSDRCRLVWLVVLFHAVANPGFGKDEAPPEKGRQASAAATQERDRRQSFSIASILSHESALNGAHDVEVNGQLAYVAGKGGALAIVDIAKAEAPRLVWYVQDQKQLPDAETVLIDGNRLYLGTVDFLSLNVADPANPTIDATIRDPQARYHINGFVRHGSTVFAADKQGRIVAFDVSAPAAPRLLGAFHVRRDFGVSTVHDIDRYGSYLVVADAQGFGSDSRPGQVAVVRAFDPLGQLLPISNWEFTSALKTVELGGANRIRVRGDAAYVGCSAVSKGDFAPRGVVVDLRTPDRPRQLAVVRFSDARGPNGQTIAGDVWFLAGGQTVEAYDISRPEQPALLAKFHSTEAFPKALDNAHDLVYRDGYLYVTGQSDHRLVILRVEDGRILQLAKGA